MHPNSQFIKIQQTLTRRDSDNILKGLFSVRSVFYLKN